MFQVKAAYDKTSDSSAVPLHYAHVYGSAEDHGCPFESIEEGGFLCEDGLHPWPQGLEY